MRIFRSANWILKKKVRIFRSLSFSALKGLHAMEHLRVKKVGFIVIVVVETDFLSFRPLEAEIQQRWQSTQIDLKVSVYNNLMSVNALVIITLS